MFLFEKSICKKDAKHPKSLVLYIKFKIIPLTQFQGTK